MEEDNVNPKSEHPSPLPTWLEDQAVSGQWVGAGGSSDLPLSETKDEEGSFVDMDEDWEYEVDQELSHQGVLGGQELCLWEEVVREFYRWQEEVMVQELCPWGAERHEELHQWPVGVRAQWGDGTQRELYHWETSVTVQELDQWDKDDETDEELSQWEEDVTGQQLFQWQREGYQQVFPLEEDVRDHPYMYQGEEDKRDPELSQVGDNSDEELSQGKHYNVQELPQWEKDVSNQKQSQSEESVSSQRLSQCGEGDSYEVWNKHMHPESNDHFQTCAQEGPGSPSSVSSQVAGEATSEQPSACSAQGSPLDTEMAAAAAPAEGAEKEKPAETLVPEVEKAPDSPFLSEELPSAETDSSVCAPHSPPDGSQAVSDLAQHTSCEMVSQASLEVQASNQQPEEHGDLEQSMAAEVEAAAPGDREESPNSALHSPCCSPSPLPCPLTPRAHSEQQEEAERGLVLAEQEREEGALAGQLELSQGQDGEVTQVSQEDAGTYQDMFQGEACPEQELSQVEASSNHELSDWHECSAQEEGKGRSYQEFSDWEEVLQHRLSQGEVESSQKFSDWEEYSEQELSHREVSSYQEVSDWEEPIGQELPEEETFTGQEVPKGNGNRPSVQSSWEDDSDKELEHDNWESVSGHSIRVKPLLREDDEWDEVSVLELSKEEDREQRLACSAEDGLPVPVPREAWVECQAFEPSHQVPPNLEAQALRGHVASPAFEERVPEAGTQSTLPALHCCPSLSAPQQGAPALGQQLAPHENRRSRLRRALRALCSLFRCPCLKAQPED